MLRSAAVLRMLSSSQRVAKRQIPALLAISSSGSSPLGQRVQQHRGYRGEAEDGVASLSKEEQALLQIALPKSKEIFRKHVAMPDLETIPPSSLVHTTNKKDSSSKQEEEDLNLEIRRKRLVYRSKQRGWLEVDLLLGTWASENVQHLNAAELDEYENFCNEETIDIYNIITLRVDIPDELKTADGTGIMERIQTWARNSPLGKADPEQYRKTKIKANLI